MSRSTPACADLLLLPVKISTEVDGYGLVAGLFAVYQDRAEKYRFRLKASNVQVVATGEGYETKSAARKGCESVQRAADGAPVVVETDG